MKKFALYSLPVLAGLLVLAWFRRITPLEHDGVAPNPRAAQMPDRASTPTSAPRSALTARQMPSTSARPPAPTNSAAASTPVPAETSHAAQRGPVIDAIRSELKGEQKRKAMLDAIRSSGESDEEWTAEAEDAFETWTEAMPKEARGGLSVAEPRCYAAGCVADVTFASPEAYRVAAQAFRTIAETRAGHGGRVQTPSEAQGKRVVASWIMLRPQDI